MNLGIDLGGTFVKAGLVEGSKVIKRISIPTEADKGKDIVLKNISSAISSIITKDVKSIGIGSPGPLDYRTGILGNAANIPLHGLNLKKFLEDKFHLPVSVDNDANCNILGEALYGAGKGKHVVVGITLGTGIGGGIIIDGKIFHSRGNAGEFGHMTIQVDGVRCKCGNHGCFEEYGGRRGLQRFAGFGKEPMDIYEKALKGDKKSLAAFEQYGKMLGVGIGNIIKSFDPDIFIIGGGIADSWGYFSAAMHKELKARELFSGCPVVKGTLPDAGIIGAANLSNH